MKRYTWKDYFVSLKKNQQVHQPYRVVILAFLLGLNLLRRNLKIFLTILDSRIISPWLKDEFDYYITKLIIECKEGLIVLHSYVFKSRCKHLDFRQLHSWSVFMSYFEDVSCLIRTFTSSYPAKLIRIHPIKYVIHGLSIGLTTFIVQFILVLLWFEFPNR